jgi:hypothetical protein
MLFILIAIDMHNQTKLNLMLIYVSSNIIQL